MAARFSLTDAGGNQVEGFQVHLGGGLGLDAGFGRKLRGHKVTSADLVDRLRQKNIKAMHLYPFEAIIEQLENLCRPNDLLVVMGAGPVWQVARGYLAAR